MIRTDGSDTTVSVKFSSSDGNAKTGVDYLYANQTVIFADGDTKKTFNLSLSYPTGGSTVEDIIDQALKQPEKVRARIA